MTRKLFISLFVILCSSNAWAGLDGYVEITAPSEESFNSHGYAAWHNMNGQVDYEAAFSGTHRVWGGWVDDSFAVSGTGALTNNLSGTADPGTCYNTSLEVTVNRGWLGDTSASYSDCKCFPLIPPDDPWELPACPTSPIVIALNERYKFTDIDSGVTFDIDADGDSDLVAWTRDASVAFLYFDRDGNHVPDDGGELFGDHTRLRDGTVARHGFEALAEFDSDHDGVVSPADAQWSRLGLWQDRDHNGVATLNELSSLDSHGLASLGIDHHWTGRRDAHGNILRWQGRVTWKTSTPRPYYDVYLQTRATP
ncbi:MAG TPA: hypothetical protein VNI54_13550 [Thermoanaerobaculia bacterium]|nr:hypothetical protein [Thermoanaerobaculia bacterium]